MKVTTGSTSWRLALCFALALLDPGALPARVFLSRQEVLQQAFPGADQVEARDLFLSPADLSHLEKVLGTRPDSPLVTVYLARKAGRVVALGTFDTHVVRTSPQTLFLTLTPAGAVDRVFMCAFYEPDEYRPRDRWLAGLKGVDRVPEAVVGRKIAAIAGSTLSAEAIARSIRRALALFTRSFAPLIERKAP